MKIATLMMVLAVAACGEKAASTAPSAIAGRTYVLTSLFYEDVVPGQYHILATDATLEGGPASWTFRDDQTGTLLSATVSILFVDTLSGVSQRVVILSAGLLTFSYQLDSLGVPTFDRDQPWPFALPTTITDSAVQQEARTCYDETCADRTVLAVGWVRQ